MTATPTRLDELRVTLERRYESDKIDREGNVPHRFADYVDMLVCEDDAEACEFYDLEDPAVIQAETGKPITWADVL